MKLIVNPIQNLQTANQSAVLEIKQQDLLSVLCDLKDDCLTFIEVNLTSNFQLDISLLAELIRTSRNQC